ncbi:alpha-D-xyloside xylohydrolase [Breznakibacter xylanolyticus]|uniref:Alpha-D-xyloside xylohydrolase n=1 Tax=Breznakibacter xylanolyticus TaxID=990 RepID=A0A2W7NE60_9BACT|nr:alpha-xylosidase [Breznakibacter xylanolyticus]PZX16397.1 alpha-D-xyloside xylohydrolase [Breznakibacter xylanolyticus]
MRTALGGLFGMMCLPGALNAQIQQMGLQNEPVDISRDFYNFTNTYYLADSLAGFDPSTGKGALVYRRHEYSTRMAFNNMLGVLRPVLPNEFPTGEYAVSPSLPIEIDFVSEKTVRIKAASGFNASEREASLMLVDGKAPSLRSAWKYTQTAIGHEYSNAHGKVVINTYPFHVAIYDGKGKLLTSTVHFDDVKESTYTPVLPFSYVRRASDYSRSFNACFTLSPDEKIFGCGESFTRLDKRGQKVVLWTDDANGIENETMYKPIPFYMSSKGYGVFMHTSSPITCDFGKYYTEASQLMIGDDQLDMFIFLGSPKDILDQYTNLTGKASMPPLWSFGLWMSRITYFSEADGRNVADKLRENKIPSDVIHFDTGWFETDWRCDYQFSSSRFKDARKMMEDLKKQGLHVCLWQLPYFVPKNTLFDEIVSKGLYVKDARGGIPYEDAVLDFSNPAMVEWYQQKIAGLLEMGVSAIKVDFGEAAPANGIYHNGRTGFYEHNLFPLRYNKAVAEITKKTNNENIMWARSAWAGSQRYPLHWGGDAANTDNAMQAQLRGGLSLGLSGFSFWSHDIGGFVLKTPEELYLRWMPFGMLTSHSRCHGMPPKEPWEYGKAFTDKFRKSVELKYKLMPYIYAQAKESSEKGLPMMRALFVEFPDDPGAWLIDNEYLFGSDILVAPLFDQGSTSRDVYLPKGKWIDYQTGKVYDGGWHHIAAGEIPVVMLVRDGAVIPHIKLAQNTRDMDWTKLQLMVYAASAKPSDALVCLPMDNVLKRVSVAPDFKSVSNNPFGGSVEFSVVKK